MSYVEFEHGARYHHEGRTRAAGVYVVAKITEIQTTFFAERTSTLVTVKRRSGEIERAQVNDGWIDASTCRIVGDELTPAETALEAKRTDLVDRAGDVMAAIGCVEAAILERLGCETAGEVFDLFSEFAALFDPDDGDGTALRATDLELSNTITDLIESKVPADHLVARIADAESALQRVAILVERLKMEPIEAGAATAVTMTAPVAGDEPDQIAN